jgi:hypothetical protein
MACRATGVTLTRTKSPPSAGSQQHPQQQQQQSPFEIKYQKWLNIKMALAKCHVILTQNNQRPAYDLHIKHEGRLLTLVKSTQCRNARIVWFDLCFAFMIGAIISSCINNRIRNALTRLGTS